MGRRIGLVLVVAAIAALFSLPDFRAVERDTARSEIARAPYAVAVQGKIEKTYRTWLASHERAGAERFLTMSLGWSRGLSSEDPGATGLARFDLVGGIADVELERLPAGSSWDVWVVDNVEGPGRSALPEEGDRMHRLGRLDEAGGRSHLRAPVPLDLARSLDVVVVTRAGDRPERRPVLFGSPMLFQRLAAGTAAAPRPVTAGLLRPASMLLGPGPAFADSPFNSLDPLVAEGADLFFNQQFGGNGRTCGTCHPAENNLTIDPRFISTLSANDPLFVAEFTPALASNFEKPTLMRKVGVILENVDGFEDLDNKFVMRGVPHLLGLSRYLVPGNQTVPPLQRLGWGGDGAPGSGTLREFATGAVVQHFTKTLARTPGIDFRLPTDHELDAMEAFQLALGRQDTPDINAYSLTSPVAERGRQLFPGSRAFCTICHFNAGANTAAGTNNNFDIGVGRQREHPAELIDPGSLPGGKLPPDGGFGRDPVYDSVTGNFLGFGLAGEVRFNTQPAIEAADTGPFFHNNGVQTIEEAVGFYVSPAFKDSQAGHLVPIVLDSSEIEAIAAFLRVTNALENIRSSSEMDQAAIDESDRDTSQAAGRPRLGRHRGRLPGARRAVPSPHLGGQAEAGLRQGAAGGARQRASGAQRPAAGAPWRSRPTSRTRWSSGPTRPRPRRCRERSHPAGRALPARAPLRVRLGAGVETHFLSW